MSNKQRSVTANSASNAVRIVIGLACSVIVAPVMIERLGVKAFGLWALTGALAVYGGLFDLGVTRALPYFVARFDAESDRRKTEQAAGLALALILGCAAVFAAASWFGAPLLQTHTKGFTVHEVRQLLLAVSAIATFNSIAQLFGCVFTGLREAVTANVIFVVGGILNFGGSIAVLILRPDVVSYAWVNAATIVATALMMFLAATRRWGRPPVAFPDRVIARFVISTSLRTQAVWAGDTLNLQAGKIAVGMFLGLESVAAYEIALRVVATTRQVAVLSVSALVPEAASRMASTRIPLASLYSDYTRKVAALVIPVFAIAWISGPAALRAWLEAAPPNTVLLLVGLGLGHLFDVLTGVGSSLALADGKAGIAARTTLGGALCSVVVIVAATPHFGVAGAVAGTTLGMGAASGAFLFLFHRRYSLPAAQLWRNLVQPLGIAGACAVGPLLAANVLSTPPQRAGALGFAAALALSFLVPYCLIASRRRLFPESLRFSRFLRLVGGRLSRARSILSISS